MGGMIIMDEDYWGIWIGFEEVVWIYLIFGEEDIVEDIVSWLVGKIEDWVNFLIIG